MSMQKGETYRCSNSHCGCEIQVTHASASSAKQNPHCACGDEMRKTPAVKAA